MVWMKIFLFIIGAIVGGAIVYLREYFILKHEYNLKTSNARIDEFIKDCKKYFGPIAVTSGELSLALSKDEIILKQKEIPFYLLAKYLYQRDFLRENTYFYFPIEEEKVCSVYDKLNATISFEMYEYNKRHIEKIISHYASNKKYNAFCGGLSVVTDEFEIFKNKTNDEVFRKKLREASDDFYNSAFAALTAAYKPWYDQYKKLSLKEAWIWGRRRG